MPDPQLDELLTQSRQDLGRVNQLQGALSYGIGQDPTQQRQVQSTARALGVTPDVVQQNPKAMNQAARLNGFDFDAFARTYPVTTQIMSNPLTAAAAHDDLETYKTLEDAFDKRAQAGEFKDLTPSQLDAVKQDAINRGVYDSRLWGGGGFATQLTDVVGALNRAVVTPFTEALKTLTPSPEQVQAANVGPWWLSPGALLHAGAQKIEGMAQAGATAEAPPQLRDPATGQMFANPLYKPWAAANVPKRVSEMVGTLGSMAAGGELTAPLFAFNAGKAKFDEVMAKTGSPWKALTEGIGYGAANLALFTKVPAPVAVEGQGVGMTALKQTARAVPLAGGMTVIDNALRQLHEPDNDYTKGFANQFITFALYENVHTLNALAGRVGDAYQNYQYLGKMNDAVKASKMANEDPQAFQDHLSQLAKGSEVGMPADSFTRYWQAQGEDPNVKAQELGITNLTEAAATGTDVQIPIDRFLAATVGTPHFEELTKDIRLTPGAPTLREADAQAQVFYDNVKSAQAELQKMATTETEHPDREAIFERTRAQLLAAGGEAAKTADETAKLLTNFSVNMAQRSSTPEKLISPQDIADRLNIFRAEPGQEATNAAQAGNRRAQGPVPGDDGADHGARGIRPQEPESVRAARISDLQSHEPDQVMAHTDRQDFRGLNYDDTTTPRLGLPATVFVNGDHIGVRVDHDGVSAWVTAQVRDGHLYTGTLKQSTKEGIPGIGTDLLQTLGREAVKVWPELQEGNLYGLAGGTLDNPDGIKRVRDRFTNTIWDGDKVSTPIRDLTDTDFSRPVDIRSEGGDEMGRMLYQPGAPGVDSPEFKRWFGKDSNLLNEDGSPMRLFHGTDANIEEFKASTKGAMGGDAIYLGQAREASAGYGSKIMEVYARGKYLDNYQWTDYIDKYGWGGAREAAMKGGWAGVRDDKFEDAVAVWDPKNIKSATGNAGTFDETSRIYHQAPVFYSALERAVPDMAKIADKNGEVQPEQAKAWLAARQKEGKFKQAELDAIGVNDWLDLQMGKVSVSALQDFISQNGVQIQEVFKGMPPDTYRHRMTPEGKFEVFNQRTGKVFGTYSDVFDAGSAIDRASGQGGSPTKFGEYTLPGGEDYRELLLTLPSKENLRQTYSEWADSKGFTEAEKARLRDHEQYVADRDKTTEFAKQFRSSHWDESNILAHVRFNTRTDAEGRRVLFLEELQSDWGQKGKKEGFDTGALAKAKADIAAYQGELYAKYGKPADIYRDYADFRDRLTSEEDAKLHSLNMAVVSAQNTTGKVPTAPFVTDTKAWVSLALKRMIRYAADNGFDRVAFVNGEQSADRYDLSKQISEIEYKRLGDDKYHIQAFDTGNRAVGSYDLNASELADHVGKDIAQKIVDQAKPEVQSLSGIDLKVGGEGMKAFYDKIVPSVANDVLKKLGGGKVSEVQLGRSGVGDVLHGKEIVAENVDRKTFESEWGDGYKFREKPKGATLTQLGFDLTPELKAKVQEGQALFQPTAGEGGARGFLEFGPDKKFNLGLLNDDKSTPIHELGHFYLEVLHDLSSTEGVSPQVKEDYGVIRRWLGAEGDAPLTTEQHEQFARAHELYMREGNAPTEGLRGVFQRFGRWLTRIYKTAEQLQVPMTDEVRGVFDRLYASDSEIEAARKAVGDLPMFASAKDMGVTEKEFAAYRKLKDAEITSAKEKLLAELTKQHADEQKAEWREALAKKRDEVAAELDADPAYTALKALTEGRTAEGVEVKLNRQALVDKYGEAILKELGRGKGYVYSMDGGMDADSAALLLGHESGDALVNALTGLEPRGKRIAREAEARLKAERGDLMPDEPALRAKALEELHSTKREEVLALELKALNRLKRGVEPVVKAAQDQLTAEQRQDQALRDTITEAQGSAAKAEARKSASEKRQIEEAMPPMKAYRVAASAFIDSMPLAKTDPNKYLLAQRKASKLAFDLQGKGNYADAAEAKHQEILNHFMYLEAVRARQEGEKSYQFAQRLQTPRVMAKLAKAGGTYLDQVNALMDRFEFGRVSNKELDRRETLAQWVEAQTAQNEEPVIADKLLDESFKVNYRQLTNADLRDLTNAMKNIKHLAYRQLDVVVGDRRVAFADLVDQLDAAARANNKTTPLPLPGSNETASQKAHDFLAGKDAAMVKIEQMVNWLDGNDVHGPWHEAIWNPLAKAETADYDLITKVTGKLMDALDQMPKEQQNSMADTFDVPGINQPLNRRQIITMLFNMGTDMNRMKLIEGYADYGFTPDTVNAALSNLNQHDTAFVQGVWNTIGDLWPHIVDLQKRLTGVEPKREEPTPVTITFKDGTTQTLDGGYFPLKAAAGRSTVAGKQESSATALFDYGGGYVKATTMTGHTKERTAAIYPLDLDFTHVIAQHTTQVVKDLTHREAVILANRLLTNPTVRKAMQESMGETYTGQFMPWLRSIVNDRNGAAASSASAWTSVATATRGNLVAALLGMKFSTVIVQLTDPLRVIGPGDYRVPVPTYTGALLDYLQHPNDVTKMVRELSGEMRHRPENLDRDIRAQWEHLQGDASWKAAWNRKAFHGLGMVDALTSVPAWLGAYRHAINSGIDPATAVLQADRTVRLTLMSGSPKDLLGVQRDPDKFMKLITMFMGDGPAQYGLLRNAGRKGLKGIPEFTAVAVMMSMANIIGDSLKGQTPAPNEDKAKFYLRKALLAWSQPIPILRDLANAVDSKLAGKPFSDYRLSPVLAVGQKVVDTIGDTQKLIEGKEAYPDYAIKAFDLLGTLYGVGGTSQAVASAKYLRRVYTGEEKPANTAELVAGAVQGKPRQGVK